MPQEFTRELAGWALKAGLADLSSEGLDRARLLCMDLLGVMARGSQEPAARLAGRVLLAQGGEPQATVVGRQGRTGALNAALLNGVAGHALDYDDVDQAMYGHPSVPVLPAALAAAELAKASGAALLEAYVLGVEVTCKLAYGMNPKHYQLGWHSTCTLGGMGATVAAARLLGLDEAQMRHALALGASQAGGLQQNFGTMAKPFHAGKAAQNGLLAALLAREGFTGDPAIFEAPLGFFHLFTAGEPVDGGAILARLGRPYEIESPGLIIKKHPSCAFSHPPADAALELFADPRCAPEKIERIAGTIHALADQILIHRQPRTGLQAKFSLEGVLALALCDGKLSLASFSDESVLRPQVRRLVGLCERRPGPAAWADAGDFGPARVEISLTGGEVLSAQVDKAKGSPDNPMSPAEFEAKYRDCCSRVLSQEQIAGSLRLLAGLERLSGVDELLNCFQAA
ncbi:MAG: MmgE/PrpD family protein [Desulfarculaceae bacterium]|nr:MmgE/PrpD family protein [Desulfarculaceae bacterium]MCF8071542.1 MmgE/PrpD family protein [Desulfarculaceae bacterium]MCF8102357.1 MmgE/PrpD family protein [Desulfarculaceae bacterium]MCF8114821.1 MmgE/PrpD family protein [Desulfarculaceae bacterium]